MMKITLSKDSHFVVGSKIKFFRAGTFETEDEETIKAFKGAKAVKLKESKVETKEDTELEELRAEYESLSGKPAHHKTGVKKLKEEIDKLKAEAKEKAEAEEEQE